MKRFLTLSVAIIAATAWLSAQVTTERCFHLDRVQYMSHRQDFWRSHVLYSTAARAMPGVQGGYFNLVEGSYGFGLGEVGPPYAHHFWGASMVNGMRFSNGLALGIGIGYQGYNGGYSMPLYGDARWYLGKQKNKFFVMGAGGVMFNFDDFSEYSRVFANPGVGMTIPVAKNMQLSVATGLYTQYVFDFDRRDSFINLKLGLLFGK